MSQLESRIQTNCINWYKRNYPNNYIRKNEQVVKSGDPDIFICHYGVFVAIEMKQVGKSPTAVSQHLAKLRWGKIVQSRQEGTRVFYSLIDEHARELVIHAVFQAEHVVGGVPPHHRSSNGKITTGNGVEQ